MTSALGSITTQASPIEPAICEHCGTIADIPVGTATICTLHEEQAHMLPTISLFSILGRLQPGKQQPEYKEAWVHYLKRMRELQAHILPEDQVATADPLGTK